MLVTSLPTPTFGANQVVINAEINVNPGQIRLINAVDSRPVSLLNAGFFLACVLINAGGAYRRICS